LGQDGHAKVAKALNTAGFNYKFYDGTSVNYKDPGQITGLKPELTANGQRHDAFRHIQTTAGLTMSTGGMGLLGMMAKDGFDVARKGVPLLPGNVQNPFYDPQGAAEDVAAIRGDIAGGKVGFTLNHAFFSGRFTGLADELKQILCQ
jgi:hypothetical protein